MVDSIECFDPLNDLIPLNAQVKSWDLTGDDGEGERASLRSFRDSNVMSIIVCILGF